MQQPALSELFRPFLETRAPLLFLIGSLALAILGNAIYELLTSTFGATPEFLIALIIGAVLVFSFVALGFRRLLRAIDARKVVVRNVVGPDQQAEPHAGLIVLVGLNPHGAEAAMIAWHQRHATLRHCWLLVTPEVEQSPKLSDLKQQLMDGNTVPHVVRLDDSLQVAQVAAQVGTVLDQARRLDDARPLIADITGGTKPMTAGTVLACLGAEVAVQYWSVPRDRQGDPRLSRQGCPMKVVVHPLHEEVAAHAQAPT